MPPDLQQLQKMPGKRYTPPNGQLPDERIAELADGVDTTTRHDEINAMAREIRHRREVEK